MATLESQHPWLNYGPGEVVETKYGRVRVRALGHSIMLDRGPTGHEDRLGPITINGVEYHHSVHVSVPNFTVEHVYLSRDGSAGPSTPAADDKWKEEAVRVARGWASANPDQLVAGEQVWRAQSAHTLAKQLDDVRADAATLAKNLRACKAGRPFQTYPPSTR